MELFRYLQNCQITNCHQCSNDSSQCVKCDSGYSLSNSQCIKDSHTEKMSEYMLLLLAIIVPFIFLVSFCFL